MHGKKLDILVLLGFMVLGFLYAYVTKDLYVGRPAIAGVVSMSPPILYLSLRKKKNWPKILVSTLIFGMLIGFIFEFIAEYNKAYSVISVLFPFKVFGVVPIDNVLGHMMMTMYTIVFYEHFVDREKHHRISKNFTHALLPALFVIATMLLIFFISPNTLRFGHPYLYMGLAAIAAPVYLGLTRPKFIKNMLLTSVYFFFFYFIAEIFAVRYSWWIYPGNNYVGWVTVFGVGFPFEELFFWMMFYAATLVSYYELFIDDHPKLKRRKAKKR